MTVGLEGPLTNIGIIHACNTFSAAAESSRRLARGGVHGAMYRLPVLFDSTMNPGLEFRQFAGLCSTVGVFVCVWVD